MHNACDTTASPGSVALEGKPDRLNIPGMLNSGCLGGYPDASAVKITFYNHHRAKKQGLIGRINIAPDLVRDYDYGNLTLKGEKLGYFYNKLPDAPVFAAWLPDCCLR
ncbi:hypothetical protein BDBG_09104 [Blastomyces gilchristii SLH14081]|uniref:Uncharacterized protein n=1 Tax=Blastomyces gilchristii (strain SLH14081) TaxID=559298 RepID=A0A179V3T7_BLAGS|nr:uncharacterized protein BDBG_09104 [Blastomyces gilchristii SLH14081]OAT14011.1 hypothetical protein BDBG_09104 [Blastomyces gilchristii SLH14081]